MPPVDQMDVDALRQLAKMLYHENTALQKEVRKLLGEVASLKGEAADDLQQRLIELLASVPDPKAANSSSESRSAGTSPKKERPPQPGHGPRQQPKLPIVNATYELDDESRDCTVCGGTVTEMTGQFEEADEITVVERRFVVVHQKRQKYRCRCNANVVTAPGDLKLKPGNRYSIDFALTVAVDKYLDHLPLERQVRIMQREGLRIDSQTLWDQINTLAGHLRPSYEALWDRALTWPVLHADETSWRLMTVRVRPSRLEGVS